MFRKRFFTQETERKEFNATSIVLKFDAYGVKSDYIYVDIIEGQQPHSVMVTAIEQESINWKNCTISASGNLKRVVINFAPPAKIVIENSILRIM